MLRNRILRIPIPAHERRPPSCRAVIQISGAEEDVELEDEDGAVEGRYAGRWRGACLHRWFAVG